MAHISGTDRSQLLLPEVIDDSSARISSSQTASGRSLPRQQSRRLFTKGAGLDSILYFGMPCI